MAISTIFFDFGKVLADFDHHRATVRLLPHSRRFGPQGDADGLDQVLYAAPRFNEFEAGRLSTHDYRGQVFAEAEFDCTPQQFASLFGDIFTPIPEMDSLTATLARRHRLLLASNTNQYHAEFFLVQMRATIGNFQDLVLSHQVGARKPESGFYAACQKFADCPPGDCLFVDDRADNIQAASRHGWQTIQFVGHNDLVRNLNRIGLI